MLNLLVGPIADLAGTWLNGKLEEKSKALEIIGQVRRGAEPGDPALGLCDVLERNLTTG